MVEYLYAFSLVLASFGLPYLRGRRNGNEFDGFGDCRSSRIAVGRICLPKHRDTQSVQLHRRHARHAHTEKGTTGVHTLQTCRMFVFLYFFSNHKFR
uniref:Putative secreted protein n=1 Tax=Ixodes ricinus TaxID=34613 RepID=A0A6B0U4J2_IXORI